VLAPRRGRQIGQTPAPRRSRRRLLATLAGCVVIAIAAVGGYVLLVLYEGRDIHGSATVEFNPKDVPTPVTPPPATAAVATAPKQRTKVPHRPAPSIVWATYGYDNERLRVAPPSNLRPPFRPVWIFHGQQLLEFPPAIAYDRLYMPTFDGRFFALNPATGRPIWRYASGRCAWSSPAVADGLVFETFLGHKPACMTPNSTSDNGELLAFNASTGRIRWRAGLGSTESSPLVVGNRIVVGDWTGNVIAFDTTTGRELWRYRTGGSVKGSAAYGDDRIFIGSYDGDLYALDPATGRLQWHSSGQPRLGSSGTFYSTPAVAYGRVYIGSTDGKVYSFGAHTGDLRWSYGTGGYVYSSPAVWHQLVLIGSYDGTFYALDAATGSLRWRFKSNGRISGSATVVNGIVYFSTLAQRTYALDAASGRLLWTWPDGKYSPVVADSERLYLVGYGRMWGMIHR
jgi:outer membrane protein assembly factor BamB